MPSPAGIVAVIAAIVPVTDAVITDVGLGHKAAMMPELGRDAFPSARSPLINDMPETQA
jgi:hypothetical protein